MCCGYAQLPPAFAPATGGGITRVLFEYAGHEPLTISGRVTGLRYHFPGPTSRAWVDSRDAPYLEVIAGLSAAAGAGTGNVR